MRSRWTKRAANNLEAILAYIERDNPRAAKEFLALMLKRVEMLEDHPLMGRTGVKPNTRQLVAHENYILHYRIKDDEVQVLRLLHAKRKYP